MEKQFIEDIYIDFVDQIESNSISIDVIDESPIRSLYNLLASNKEITDKQGNLILRLLKKYANKISLPNNNCIVDNVNNPQWKKPFRKIDQTRKIFVEKDQDDNIFVCIKFPYNLIKEFETEIKSSSDIDMFESLSNYYDRDRKLRVISIYDVNLIHLNDFVRKHNFEVDSTFEFLISYVEQIWQEQNKIIPYSKIKNNEIVLRNCSANVTEFFETSKTGVFNDDMFLAKTMGFPLRIKSPKILEKLCSSFENLFWCDTLYKFFSITENITGSVLIILDRSIKAEQWISKYTETLDSLNISRNSTRVCFRESNDVNPNFNKFIKQQGLTGPLSETKYFIFKDKPAKWLIKDLKKIKIIATTSLFKISNSGSEFWRNNHPCVIYLNDECKPNFGKGINIVSL